LDSAISALLPRMLGDSECLEVVAVEQSFPKHSSGIGVSEKVEKSMTRLSILDLAFVPEGATPADALRNTLDLA